MLEAPNSSLAPAPGYRYHPPEPMGRIWYIGQAFRTSRGGYELWWVKILFNLSPYLRSCSTLANDSVNDALQKGRWAGDLAQQSFTSLGAYTSIRHERVLTFTPCLPAPFYRFACNDSPPNEWIVERQTTGRWSSLQYAERNSSLNHTATMIRGVDGLEGLYLLRWYATDAHQCTPVPITRMLATAAAKPWSLEYTGPPRTCTTTREWVANNDGGYRLKSAARISMAMDPSTRRGWP